MQHPAPEVLGARHGRDVRLGEHAVAHDDEVHVDGVLFAGAVRRAGDDPEPAVTVGRGQARHRLDGHGQPEVVTELDVLGIGRQVLADL